jgi:hypothetical protein
MMIPPENEERHSFFIVFIELRFPTVMVYFVSIVDVVAVMTPKNT